MGVLLRAGEKFEFDRNAEKIGSDWDVVLECKSTRGKVKTHVADSAFKAHHLKIGRLRVPFRKRDLDRLNVKRLDQAALDKLERAWEWDEFKWAMSGLDTGKAEDGAHLNSSACWTRGGGSGC